jgi:RNA polymerase sigma factor (sigma-70 family)
VHAAKDTAVAFSDESVPAQDAAQGAQGGDRAAFDALYRENVGRVFALCWRMSGSRVDGEELTQDVFVRAWRRFGTFRGESEFSSWLYRLAINVVLQARRSQSRWHARFRQADDEELGRRAGRWPLPDARIDLERLIAELPEGARIVLVLHDIEGFKHEEIARMLGLATGTVKAQLHRARKLLRKGLEA